MQFSCKAMILNSFSTSWCRVMVVALCHWAKIPDKNYLIGFYTFIFTCLSNLTAVWDPAFRHSFYQTSKSVITLFKTAKHIFIWFDKKTHLHGLFQTSHIKWMVVNSFPLKRKISKMVNNSLLDVKELAVKHGGILSRFFALACLHISKLV